MHGQYNKLDVAKALKLRDQGLSNAIIATRLGVSHGAISLTFRKHDAVDSVPENVRPAKRMSCWT
jgi:hypothetical protein